MLLLALACAGSELEPVNPLLERAWATVEGTLERPVGEAVFNLGDINGDGLDELGLGWVDGGDDDAPPRLGVFWGGFTGAQSVDDAPLLLSDDSRSGWLVALSDCESPRVPGHVNVVNLGDIDKDGLAELAIGLTEGGGGVYVHTGAALTSGEPTWPMRGGRWSLYGSGDWAFGAELAVGHFDPDPVLDLAIGAPVSSSPERAGRVYIVSGRSLATALGSGMYASELGGVIVSYVTGALLGERLATVPDFDGDGVDELAMLAPGCGGAGDGNLYVQRGRDLPRANQWVNVAPWVTFPAEPDLRANLVSLGDADGDSYADLALAGVSSEIGDHIVTLSGAHLAAGGLVGPSSGFQTGADSRYQMQPWVSPRGVELLAHDGEDIVRVPEPLSAQGWYKSDEWPSLCQQDELMARRKLLATGDFNGDGQDDLVVADPLWPSCDEDEDNPGIVLVFTGD